MLIPDTRPITHKLAITKWTPREGDKGLKIYLYIYIYMCVCIKKNVVDNTRHNSRPTNLETEGGVVHAHRLKY